MDLKISLHIYSKILQENQAETEDFTHFYQSERSYHVVNAGSLGVDRTSSVAPTQKE